jgi:hypothetical protein
MFREAQKCPKSPIRLSQELVHAEIAETSIGLFGTPLVRAMRTVPGLKAAEPDNLLAGEAKPLAETN